MAKSVETLPAVTSGCRRVILDVDEQTHEARAVYAADCSGELKPAPLDPGTILMLLRLLCPILRRIIPQIGILCDLLGSLPAEQEDP